MKALEQYQIDELYLLSSNKTYGELAAIYHISPATVKQYVTIERAKREAIEGQLTIDNSIEKESKNIKIYFVNEKTFNLDGVTDWEKDVERGVYLFYGLDNEVISICEAQNVTVILPR